ncbi:MAG: (2Fe-2S)-binding protein [Planctomycetota bacterium]|jgi:aerobic-type carbon monoxide dehydrogenase small subunit (CoxS/CutS family)
MDATITLIVNGQRKTVVTDPERPLLEVLREDLGVMGPKYGCGEGQCGACTVLMDGQRALSCVTRVGSANDKEITTIEGLVDGDRLHPVQQAFLDEGAIQCGYCTPGMILSAVALLEENPRPTDEQIVEWMNGNICRCNGYAKILNAVRRAASQTKEMKRS